MFDATTTLVGRRARDGVHATSDLPALLPDHVACVVIVPFTDATRGLVDAALLAAMPAAPDVTDPEPLPADHPLRTAPGLLLTAHVGVSVPPALGRAHRVAAEQIAQYAAGSRPDNLVQDGYRPSLSATVPLMSSSDPTSTIPTTGWGKAAPEPTRSTKRPLAWNGGTDVGLLLLRLGIGGPVFAHGAQKVFGLWGGPGIGGFAADLTALGYQQATTLSWVTGITELIAGTFVVLGVVAPLASAAVLAVMIDAVLLRFSNGVFVSGPAGGSGIEFSTVLGLGAACLVFSGPGRIALDNGRAWHRRPASWGVLSLVIGIAAAVLVYILLRRPQL